ncbi:MAG: response regulator [Candidatus Omnitrophica bacterium]|nr:response regulator [Candidatus Omnitrophota bacterium]MDD5487849.1 response regulator [Candidatus Omnitrophota bacterium]
MPKKVLIIDDEKDVSITLLYRLKAKGYHVFAAETGAEGIEKASAEKPDMIILDFRLPDMKASEVADTIRSMQGMAGVPVILITASVEDMEEKSKECGAVGYLGKPIDTMELCSRIESILGGT